MQTPRPTAARGWKLEQTTQQAPPCMFWQQRHSRLQGLTSPKPGTPRDEGCFCINKIFRGKKKKIKFTFYWKKKNKKTPLIYVYSRSSGLAKPPASCLLDSPPLSSLTPWVLKPR